MIMFQFIFSSLIVTLFQASFVECFASQLAQKCDIPMEVGVLMMGTAATFNETHRLQLFREDRTELNSGGITATPPYRINYNISSQCLYDSSHRQVLPDRGDDGQTVSQNISSYF
jgi:hypothetical protein